MPANASGRTVFRDAIFILSRKRVRAQETSNEKRTILRYIDIILFFYKSGLKGITA